MRIRLAPAALTAAVLLSAVAGCGGNDSKGPARYDKPQDLVAALEKADVACSGYDETEGATGAVARGSCRMSGGEVIVSIYATKADADGEPQRKRNLLGGMADVTMVVGENWTASCDTRADCEKIEGVTGGKLVHLPA